MMEESFDRFKQEIVFKKTGYAACDFKNKIKFQSVRFIALYTLLLKLYSCEYSADIPAEVTAKTRPNSIQRCERDRNHSQTSVSQQISESI